LTLIKKTLTNIKLKVEFVSVLTLVRWRLKYRLEQQQWNTFHDYKS